VQFILRRDANERFRFASLQSEFAKRALAGHGVDPADLDTVYVLVDDGASKTLLAQSDAVIFVLRELGGVWRPAAWILRFLPRAPRDWLYRLVARNRYRVFGRYETCPVPNERERARFLDS
jgi:predicted DCC family thiol-disulfide oxidoreductase YuxK